MDIWSDIKDPGGRDLVTFDSDHNFTDPPSLDHEEQQEEGARNANLNLVDREQEEGLNMTRLNNDHDDVIVPSPTGATVTISTMSDSQTGSESSDSSSALEENHMTGNNNVVSESDDIRPGVAAQLNEVTGNEDRHALATSSASSISDTHSHSHRRPQSRQSASGAGRGRHESIESLGSDYSEELLPEVEDWYTNSLQEILTRYHEYSTAKATGSMGTCRKTLQKLKESAVDFGEVTMTRCNSLPAFAASTPIGEECCTRDLSESSNSTSSTVKGTPIEVRGEGDICALCCEEFETGDAVSVLPCGHIFHTGSTKTEELSEVLKQSASTALQPTYDEESSNCRKRYRDACKGILYWLEDHQTCPQCRNTLPPKVQRPSHSERIIVPLLQRQYRVIRKKQHSINKLMSEVAKLTSQLEKERQLRLCHDNFKFLAGLVSAPPPPQHFHPINETRSFSPRGVTASNDANICSFHGPVGFYSSPNLLQEPLQPPPAASNRRFHVNFMEKEGRWQDPVADKPVRSKLLADVYKLIGANCHEYWTMSQDQRQRRLGHVAARVELVLYWSAATKELYLDKECLGRRVSNAVALICNSVRSRAGAAQENAIGVPPHFLNDYSVQRTRSVGLLQTRTSETVLPRFEGRPDISGQPSTQ